MTINEETAAPLVGVKECTEAFNCFSTSYSLDVDLNTRAISPWKYEGKTMAQAMAELLKVVENYEVGQNEIDMGGFNIEEVKPEYIYAQFETGKKGFIDDLEFAVQPGTNPEAKSGNILVRSASRMGFYDYGVNAVRLNFISEKLRALGGWTAPVIDGKSHPGYWKNANCGSKKVKEIYPQFCE